MAARERELLVLLETGSPGGDRGWLHAMGQSLSADAEAMQRAYTVYARMDALAEADEEGPQVEETARAIVETIPDEAAQAMIAAESRGATHKEAGLADALLAEFTPAQAAAVRRAAELLRERAG
jgi:hypothetical protein